MAQGSVKYHSGDNLMCTCNDTGNLVPTRYSYRNSVVVRETNENSPPIYTCWFTPRWTTDAAASPRKFYWTSMMTNAPFGRAHSGRLWTQHEWSYWFWKTNESQFEIHLLHSTIRRKWKWLFVNGFEGKGQISTDKEFLNPRQDGKNS